MHAFVYVALCLLAVGLCVRPLGTYMARVYSGKPIRMLKFMIPLERLLYRIIGVDPKKDMDWKAYTLAIIIFGMAGIGWLFAILSIQAWLPLNPQGFANLSPDLAFNAAVSFVTNTNWQSYGGESTLSYFSQAAGLAVQNFISAATGLAVAAAFFRGLAVKKTSELGNAWVDIIRTILYILLPLSFIFALFLASQGVIQNFSSYTAYTPIEHAEPEALIAQGPVASQVAIKMLGSNGGGFFNANGAHPFENPTVLSNFLQIVAILLLPAALLYSFGLMVGDRRQGWSILAAMLAIFIPLAIVTVFAESQGNPRFDPLVIDQSDGNIEGKEVRFGTASSALWGVATTATSNGAVNSMHDSHMPLSNLAQLVLMQFGEVIFGGVGTGAYSMIIYVLLTVFIGGLMVGRTPEYLGKKLGAFEIKMASLCILIPAATVLFGAAIAVSTEAGRVGIFNPGAQGFSEILYAFSSAANNNGSALAGLSANTPFYNILLAVAMLIGRYGVIVPVLALAGSLALKNKVPNSLGTLPTHTPLFTVMLVGSILLIDVLTYVPALALGPIAEHMHLFYSGAMP